MYVKHLVVAIVLIYSGSSLAEGFKSEKDIREFTDNLMTQIVNEEFQKAFDSAKPYWPLPVVEIDGIVNKINQQWPLVSQRFGKAIGKEFIRKEDIGKSFLRYYYLHKFEKHAIYSRVDFYRPQDEWKINSVVFLDSLDVLYE